MEPVQNRGVVAAAGAVVATLAIVIAVVAMVAYGGGVQHPLWAQAGAPAAATDPG